MAIKTDVKEIEKDTVEITVEVPSDEIGGTIKSTYRDIANRVRIPGFRKGKAPKAIIDQMVGQEVVLQEALQVLIPQYYPQAVESSGIEPVTTPEIDVVQMKEDEPLIFKAKVQVKPEIKLGAYDDLEVELPAKGSVEDEVKEQIDKLRDNFATLEVVGDRPAELGDYVLIDYDGFIDNKPFEGGQGTDYMLELGSKTFIPGFEDQLVGTTPGTEKDVPVTFPAEYRAEHLAGREAEFKVKVKEIKHKKLPEVDDDLAKNVSRFDTLEELKSDLRQTIEQQRELEEKSASRQAAVDKMAEISAVELPSGMVDRRVDEMLQDFASRIKQYQNMSLEQWLSATGSSPQDIQESYRKEAERSLKAELVMEQVIKAENIEATPEDIDNEIKRLAEGSKRDVEELRKEIAERQGYDFLKERLTLNKAVDFLVSKAKIKKKDDADESSTDSR